MTVLGKERAKDFEAIYAGVSGLLDRHQGDPDSRAFNAFLFAAKMATEGILSALDDGKPVISYNLGGIPELLLALGENENEIFPFAMEKVVALQSLVGDSNYNMESIDLAEAQGMSSDVCSTDRATIGNLSKKILPESLCSVFVTAPCDSQTVAAESIKEITAKDVFMIDIPHLHGEREINYVAGQLKEEIKFLEEKSGKKLNWDRLKEVCAESNRMIDQALEWLELRKTVPCPQTSKMLSTMYILLQDGSGTKGGTWVASEFAADAKERVLAGKSAAPGGEKIRAIWFGSPTWYNIGFYEWMENELGMVVPVDMFSYVVPEMYVDTSTPETILHDLARKQIFMPMGRHFTGAPEYFVDDLLRAVSDYKADCALFAGHVSCKHAWGIIGLLKEALREADVPLLDFEFDLFDPRITSTETLQEQFRRFAHDVVLPRLNR
ncbi:MAG: 2-hydroxyacyl-CoA dehydratase [Desulfomonile tiedjei]|uniref:2-hydroxyacyl-CoA dehydratase n=1 Tax=Desulfomonile tiedjei TaxID=2358 RepID=A0A9D6V6M5_9BACT|nr:2-hydroxyacyl-CoA dehydratase [Desulfomonile tiedjei]